MLTLRRDIEVAWDLLSVIKTDEFEKILWYQHCLNEKFKINVSFNMIKEVSWRLSQAGLIVARRRHGIKGSPYKRVFLLDVYRAMAAPLRYRTDHPAGKVMGRIHDHLSQIFIELGANQR